MAMPSMTRWGSPSRTARFINAPGSPSSALQMTYLGLTDTLPINSHFTPVGKPAPPRPRRPLALISAMTCSDLNALVGVADDILGFDGHPAHQLPLRPGGETRAAAAAQAAGLDFGDDLFGRHPGEDFAEGGVAVAGDVFLDFLGVNHAAVFEDDLGLFGQERKVALGGDDVVAEFFPGQQPLAGPALDEMFLHQFRHVQRRDALIKGAVGVDEDDRTKVARPHAAGHDHLDFFVQRVFLKFGREGVRDGGAAGTEAAGAAANQYVGADHAGYSVFFCLPTARLSTFRPFCRCSATIFFAFSMSSLA